MRGARGSWRRPRPPLPFGFGCAALGGEAASGQRVLGRVLRDGEVMQGGPRETGQVEPDGADPAQPNRHSRAGLRPTAGVRGDTSPATCPARTTGTAVAVTQWPRCPPCFYSAPTRAPENIYGSSAPPAATQFSCAAFGRRGPALVVEQEQQPRPRREVWRESSAPYGGIRGGGKRRRAGGR